MQYDKHILLPAFNATFLRSIIKIQFTELYVELILARTNVNW